MFWFSANEEHVFKYAVDIIMRVSKEMSIKVTYELLSFHYDIEITHQVKQTKLAIYSHAYP